MGIYDADGFYTHEEGDAAAPGGLFSALLNFPPIGAAIKAYVDARILLVNANPVDATIAAAIALGSSLTRAEVEKLRYRRNLIHNGAFRVNQRAAVSGTSLAVSDFFFDRWRSTVAANPVTWVTAPQGQSITVPASKGIRQTVERANVSAGVHRLSWVGSAQARVYNAGAGAPALASGPLTVTLDGLDDVRVEFGPGTVSQVQLEFGPQVTPFERIGLGEELALCQRYYWQWRASAPFDKSGVPFGFQLTTTSAKCTLRLPVDMRVLPTLSWTGMLWGDEIVFNAGLTALNLDGQNAPTARGMFSITANWSGAQGAVYRPGTLSGANSSAFMALSAEF